jgi:hypothetical protein
VIGLLPGSIAHAQVTQPEISTWNVAEMAYIISKKHQIYQLSETEVWSAQRIS